MIVKKGGITIKKLIVLLLSIIFLCCAACEKNETSFDLDTPATSSSATFKPAFSDQNQSTSDILFTPGLQFKTPGSSFGAENTFTPGITPIVTATPLNTPQITPGSVTPTPTKAATVTPTIKPTATPKLTVTPTIKPTATPKLTVTPTIKPTATPKTHVPITDEILNKIEAGFLRLVNEERASLGLNPLTINLYLDNYALIRSQEIVTYFSHTRPDGSDCFSGIDTNAYDYITLGENIAQNHHLTTNYVTEATRYFTGSDEQIKNVYTNFFNAFKNSPGHYANMINASFKECGIGISVQINSSANVPYFYLVHFFGAT